MTTGSTVHQHLTRGANQIITPATRLHATDKSPTNAGVAIYNRLPTELKDKPEKSFRKHLLRLLTAAAPYSVNEFLESIEL